MIQKEDSLLVCRSKQVMNINDKMLPWTGYIHHKLHWSVERSSGKGIDSIDRDIYQCGVGRKKSNLKPLFFSRKKCRLCVLLISKLFVSWSICRWCIIYIYTHIHLKGNYCNHTYTLNDFTWRDILCQTISHYILLCHVVPYYIVLSYIVLLCHFDILSLRSLNFKDL